MSSFQLIGTNAAAVINLLKARRNNPRSLPDRKLGLIVEGGGMRGVLSAGALLAIDLMGFRPAFNKVFATSAGAVNAAFFLSGQGKQGIAVYFDHINNRNFINPLRVSKIVDVDFVYDHIITEIVRLDEQKLRKVRSDFLLSLTEVSEGKNVLIDVATSDETVAKLLKASSAIPVLYNKLVDIDGGTYVDGGVTCTIPVCQACNRGCTDILILLTKPSDHLSKPPGYFEQGIFYAMIGWKYPALMHAFISSYKNKRRDRLMAAGHSRFKNVNIATICPSKADMHVKRTTLNRKVLLRGACSMALQTAAIFEKDKELITTTFKELSKKVSFFENNEHI